ncbi:MAG: transposase [Gemmatimonadetes bacterium]|nr:transposase [Gemmatimonadota bacterium]
MHLHMIFVDGAYRTDGVGPPVFRHVPAPGTTELQALVQRIAERIGRLLERRGLIERDDENAWLSGDRERAGSLDDLIGHSITYRIAVGARAGQRVFTLQTVPAHEEGAGRNGAAQAGGFSLHAGRDIQPGQHAQLERLCRYVSRPPVAAERLALTPSGQVRYALENPYRDGTTHIVLEPLDLMARLAALVPPPRMHLTRYHGVFAPHSSLRAAITAARRGPGGKGAEEGADKCATPRHVAMSWAQRLKRVFAIEIDTCARCHGRLRVIASIEDPEVITRILAHLDRASGTPEPELAPRAARAPPPPRQSTLL